MQVNEAHSITVIIWIFPFKSYLFILLSYYRIYAMDISNTQRSLMYFSKYISVFSIFKIFKCIFNILMYFQIHIHWPANHPALKANEKRRTQKETQRERATGWGKKEGISEWGGDRKGTTNRREKNEQRTNTQIRSNDMQDEQAWVAHLCMHTSAHTDTQICMKMYTYARISARGKEHRENKHEKSQEREIQFCAAQQLCICIIFREFSMISK